MSLHKHREQDIPVSRCHYTNTENKTYQSPDVITQNTENKTYQSLDIITQTCHVITQTQRTRHTSHQMSLHKHREQDIPVSRCHYTNTENKTYQSLDNRARNSWYFGSKCYHVFSFATGILMWCGSKHLLLP